MKKAHYVVGLVLVLTLTGFSGCSNEPKPQKPPEQVLQEGIKKLIASNTYQFEFGALADITAPTEPKKTNLALNLSGGVDVKNTQNPLMNLKADLSGTADEQTGSGLLEVRLNQNMLYFTLAKLAVTGGPDVSVPKEFTDQYVGKWWKLLLPPAVMNEFSTTLASIGNDATMDPQQKKMKQLIEQTNFIKDISYSGSENIKGEQSYHYHAVLNKEAVVEFFVKFAELQGQQIDAEGKKQLTDGLTKVDFSGDFWVGKESGILNQMKGDIKFKGEATEPQGTIAIHATLWDFNKPIVVEAPKDAQNLPADLIPADLNYLGMDGVDPNMLSESQEMNTGSQQKSDASGGPTSETQSKAGASEEGNTSESSSSTETEKFPD